MKFVELEQKLFEIDREFVVKHLACPPLSPVPGSIYHVYVQGISQGKDKHN
jgi:hypothetical protein